MTYNFHDKENAVYFNMNSKIAHHSALNHFSENSIGVCDSGVSDVLKHVTSWNRELKSSPSIKSFPKDVYIIGSGSGEWSKSEKVYNWHASKLSTDSTEPAKDIRKTLSNVVILRKIEGIVH